MRANRLSWAETCHNVLLDTQVKDNNRKGAPFSNDKIRHAIGKVMEETEA